MDKSGAAFRQKAQPTIFGSPNLRFTFRKKNRYEYHRICGTLERVGGL